MISKELPPQSQGMGQGGLKRLKTSQSNYKHSHSQQGWGVGVMIKTFLSTLSQSQVVPVCHNSQALSQFLAREFPPSVGKLPCPQLLVGKVNRVRYLEKCLL